MRRSIRLFGIVRISRKTAGEHADKKHLSMKQ